ncbi:MAG: DUF362 domain-containing protein [Candidatus Lokiarchaeota archaeon]|nr:DUF362 domain-containing protein [Candidatus Lokiarchaeota archaeon]
MESDIYFMHSRAMNFETSLAAKGVWLFEKAGLNECFEPGDSVAVKLHMGEYFNTAYLRPVLVRAIVDKIKEFGGKPFVTDTTTLPYYEFINRVTAKDHLFTAAMNGFTRESMGCPIVIADGAIGTDDVRISLPEGFILQEQYIGREIADADALIVLSHFKGHPIATFGGAIKNIGVGCASKRGKYNLHLGGHPTYGVQTSSFHPELCKGKSCKNAWYCGNSCPEGAIEVTEDSIKWDRSKCKGCTCHMLKTLGCGVFTLPDGYFEVTSAAIADSALALMKLIGKDNIGFVNYAIDITPLCDCVPWADTPMLPNIGVFASKDPLAIDQVCVDKATEIAAIPGSQADEYGVGKAGDEKFTIASSLLGIDVNIQLKVGEKIGLGSRKYNLMEIEPGEPEHFRPRDIPLGTYMAKKYELGHPFPEKGFKRKEKVDLDFLIGKK